MTQAEKGIKEFQTRIPLILDSGEKIAKKKNSKKIQKIKKQLPGVSFSQNGIRQDEIGHERDKQMLNPNSANTRPGGGGKFRKKIQKKFKKLKKQLSGVIFSQNGMRQDKIGRERDKRILDPNSAHTRPGGENSER